MILFAFSFLLLIFAAIIGYTWYRLQKTVRLHAKAGGETPDMYQLPFQSVSFTSLDNVSLSGWYIPVIQPKAVVILVHGRALKNGGKSMMLPHANYLYKNNYSTFLFDLRGYGESQGNTVGFGEKEWQDVAAAFTYVASMNENKKIKIGFLGISLGATVSLIASGKENIGDFVIASTPYKTHSSLFAYQVDNEHVFPKFIFSISLQLAASIELGFGYWLYNAGSFISRIKAPIFLISARKDLLVNPKDAWNLYSLANKPKEYWEADSSHDVFGKLPEEFENRILNFLRVYTE